MGRGIGGRARRSAAALCAALALGLAGCARPAPPPAAVYPYAADAPRVFYATGAGLSEMTYQGETEAALPASRAPQASVLSADAAVIAVAVNGWGLERIEAAPDGRAYRIVDSPLPSVFAGLATGGAWPLGGGFLVQLFRDPFIEQAEAGAPGAVRPSAARLAYFGGAAGAAARTPNPFPPDLAPGFEPFALLTAKGRWFAELRKDTPDRVELKFYALDDPLAAGAAGAGPAAARPAAQGKAAQGPGAAACREIGRAEFEAALKPQPLSSLGGEEGAALRSALALLGAGPWLARLRSAEGADRWYLSSGKAEEAANAYAWKLSGEGGAAARVAALSSDGGLALSGGGGAAGSLTRLAAPAEGASFTALAAAGGLAAAAWEAGDFPDISSAGIVVAAIPRQ